MSEKSGDIHNKDTLELKMPGSRPQIKNRPGVRVDKPFETRRAVRSGLVQTSSVEETEITLEEEILRAIEKFEAILDLIEKIPAFNNNYTKNTNHTYRNSLERLEEAVKTGASHRSLLTRIDERVIKLLESLVLTYGRHDRVKGHFVSTLEKFRKIREKLNTKVVLG